MLVRKSWIESRAEGCICGFGCQSCGEPVERMGNCPAFDPCPVGREHFDGCQVHGEAAVRARALVTMADSVGGLF